MTNATHIVTKEIIQVPLNLLTVANQNVRDTDVDHGIDLLADSINKNGLLVPVIAYADGKNKNAYKIVGGQRRYLALRSLAADKSNKDFSNKTNINVVVTSEENARQYSLAENSDRLDMSPVDEFYAIEKFIEEDKKSIVDVALILGKTERHVIQQLKLSKVHPDIVAQYAKGDISRKAVEAYTVCADQDKQLEVSTRLNNWQRDQPHTIRQALTETKVNGSDKRAVFIGEKDYIRAGGYIENDLFSEGSQSKYFSDPLLLDKMVEDKLTLIVANQIDKNGWLWADELQEDTEYYYSPHNDYEVIQPTETPLSKKDAKREGAIEARMKELEEFSNSDEILSTEVLRKYQLESHTLETELNVLNAKQFSYTAEQKAECGVLVQLQHDGEIKLYEGLKIREASTDNKAKGAGG